MPDDFTKIAKHAANALRTRCAVCDIGVRRLHGIDRTWVVVFGQQPLREPFTSMVNAITAKIATARGEPVAIAADDTLHAWALLARVPFMLDLWPLRNALYVLLAERTPHHTADQIARLAAGPGESALLDAHDVFESAAARVPAVVRSIQPQGSSRV